MAKSQLYSRIKNINDLPEDCLMLILERCGEPLQRLITYRAVCRHWAAVITGQLCDRKRTLKLFGTLENLITYCGFLTATGLTSDEAFRLKPIGRDDDLVIRNDVDHHYLVDLFPNVENLVLYLTRFSSRTFNMPAFDRLTSLTLIYMPYPIDLQHQVWSAINSMRSLTGLHLFYIFQCTIPEEMPILAQLKNFSLDGYYGDIVSVLGKLGGSLRRLHLDDVHCSMQQLQQSLDNNLEMTSQLTHLTLGSINNGKPAVNQAKQRHIFDFFCSKFTALRYLAFTSYATYKLDEIIGGLVRLPHLSELHLPNSWSTNLGTLGSKSEISTSKAISSVRRLFLNFNTGPDSEQEEFPQLDLFQIFPELEEVNVIGGQKLLAHAEERLAHYHKWHICQVNFVHRCDDIGQHIGRHVDRYQKYLQELDSY